jgi:hypothetical protein
LSGLPLATGGTVTSNSGYQIHTFTGTGIFVSANPIYSIN